MRGAKRKKAKRGVELAAVGANSATMRRLKLAFAMSARIDLVGSEPCLED